ncbi:hypothetical protein GLOTRDRAFT_39806 [Gloeophyllum trabeum ATCC 11539]|uniref:Uncharacterized protein n=1 Tax=Gloeophyllum trabeum (strain ATCC 11539 / FP-39264 / Madison 617) TaxID=670483 RepID=S7RQ56_GLOTA|nr:uncharacterized protein GLOTRDRAFT_39806 [Gloeophyllum trabeum ATCC 11539]EPQ56725.1 hypothetical protein GLOTRDRAFT_39806 [Gloeophyllum trabeum ATCC 11539]
MCYNIITYVHYSCGHRVNTGYHRIDCNGRNCSLSQMHRRDEHDCQSTCRQNMMADQHVIMEQNPNPCDACAAGMPNGH